MHRGLRATAAAAVVLVVAAVSVVTGPARRPVLAAATVTLTVGAVMLLRRGGRRSALASSAAVAAALTGAVLLEDLLVDVTTLLWLTGTALTVLGVALDERRLTAAGVVSIAVELGRPITGDTFTHCLVAPDVAIPIPRLTGPLVVATVAVVVGTAARATGRRRSAGRGLEGVGAIGVAVLLVARGAELPGLRALCGPGVAIDAGWVAVGIAFGVLAALYGLAGRDQLWAGVGLGSVAAQGLVATALTGSPGWAIGCAAPLVAGLSWADRRGLAWPDRPGYGVARPAREAWRGLLRGRDGPP